MDQVYFVQSLNIQVLPGPREFVEYHTAALEDVSVGRLDYPPADTPLAGNRVERHQCLVLEFRRRDRPPLYVAMSDEVEELLEIPVCTLQQQLKDTQSVLSGRSQELAEARARLATWEQATPWALLKVAARRLFGR